MTKRAIPQIPIGQDVQTTGFNKAVKENLEIIMGQRVTPLVKLSGTATTSDIISKINEIIDRLQ